MCEDDKNVIYTVENRGLKICLNFTCGEKA